MDSASIDSLEKKFLVLQSEHQELLAYRNHWMSSWWRIPVFLLILSWSWFRQYRNWSKRFDHQYETHFKPLIVETFAICEEGAKQGKRPYIAILAELDQLQARNAEIES